MWRCMLIGNRLLVIQMTYYVIVETILVFYLTWTFSWYRKDVLTVQSELIHLSA
jgi:hypothetical protein